MKKIILLALIAVFAIAKPTVADRELLADSLKNYKMKKQDNSGTILKDMRLEGDTIVLDYLVDYKKATQDYSKIPYKSKVNIRFFVGNAFKPFMINEFKNKFVGSVFQKKGFDIKMNAFWKDTGEKIFSYKIKGD